MGYPEQRQRLATGSDARGVFKPRHVGAAFSLGPDQAGARFLSVSHGGSFGMDRAGGYGNGLRGMA
jgi:hypothetical protein